MADKTPPTPAPANRIYQQIEATADLYDPSVYDLLTFQRRSWQTSGDPSSKDFIPLSAVKARSPQDYKMFVVGLIPPSANVTGRLLDRSATVAAIQGFSEDVDVAGSSGGGVGTTNGLVVTAAGYAFGPTSGANTVGTPIQPGALNAGHSVDPAYTTHSRAEMYHIFHDAYVKVFGREPTPNEVLFLVVQSCRETGGKWPNNNPGFLGNASNPDDPRIGGPGANTFKHAGAYWISYNDPVSGAASMVKTVYGNAAARAAAESGDPLGYCAALAASSYYGDDSVNMYYHGSDKSPKQGLFPTLLKESASEIKAAGGPAFNIGELPANAPDNCAFNETGEDYRKRVGWAGPGGKGFATKPPAWVAEKGIDTKNAGAVFASASRFNKNSLYDESCPLTGDTPNDPNGKATSFAGGGSEAKAKAEKDADKKANKDLNQSELGQALLKAQKAYIEALQISLEQMRRTPPLRMLVNPTSFKPSEEKVIADGSFSRNGTIVEHWGEQQIKISASGRLAGFYSLDVGGSSVTEGAAGSSPGLGRMARNFSESYQNFLSLYLIYRNNGTIWLENTFAGEKSPKANNLALVGSVYIYYDNVLYIGSFDSFNVTESDDKPFTLEYDYSFTVRARFELDRIPDPQENYGASTLFATAFPAVATKTIPTTTAVTEAPIKGTLSPGEQAIVDSAAKFLAEEKADAEAAAVVGPLDALFAPPPPLKSGPKGNNPVLGKK